MQPFLDLQSHVQRGEVVGDAGAGVIIFPFLILCRENAVTFGHLLSALH